VRCGARGEADDAWVWVSGREYEVSLRRRCQDVDNFWEIVALRTISLASASSTPRPLQVAISDKSGFPCVDTCQAGKTATASISIIKSGRNSAATWTTVLVGGLSTSM
jgi:hypothetical protein